MKHLSVLISVVVVAASFLLSCEQAGTQIPEVPEKTEIPFAPIFGVDSFGTLSISVDDTDSDWLLIAFAPLVTGVTDNDGTYSDGDAFDVPYLGETITVTVEQDSAAGTVTYAGTITSGSGGFRMVFYTESSTFDYEQYIVIWDPKWSTDFFFFQFMENVAMDENNYYHAPFDFIMQQSGSTGGHFLRTDGDYFYGVGENAKMVSGWATWCEWTEYSGTAFDGSADFPLPPTVEKLDQYLTAIADTGSWTPFAFDEGFFVYMEDGLISPEDGVHHPHTYGSAMTAQDALDELHAAIPWTTLFGQ